MVSICFCEGAKEYQFKGGGDNVVVTKNHTCTRRDGTQKGRGALVLDKGRRSQSSGMDSVCSLDALSPVEPHAHGKTKIVS